jgi:hypothetical protein
MGDLKSQYEGRTKIGEASTMDTDELREKAREMFPHQPGLAEKTYLWLAADEIDRLRTALRFSEARRDFDLNGRDRY